MSCYVIAGGREGKERLKLLSQVLRPTTSRLLQHNVNLSEGIKCLDVGCGGGFVTALMANIVGPEGEVVGVDADEEILKLARADAEAKNRRNVTLGYRFHR